MHATVQPSPDASGLPPCSSSSGHKIKSHFTLSFKPLLSAESSVVQAAQLAACSSNTPGAPLTFRCAAPPASRALGPGITCVGGLHSEVCAPGHRQLLVGNAGGSRTATTKPCPVSASVWWRWQGAGWQRRAQCWRCSQRG